MRPSTRAAAIDGRMAGERVCSSGFADHISERRQGDGELPRRGGRRRAVAIKRYVARSEEHTSELQSLMRISYAVFCLKKKNHNRTTTTRPTQHLKTKQRH